MHRPIQKRQHKVLPIPAFARVRTACIHQFIIILTYDFLFLLVTINCYLSSRNATNGNALPLRNRDENR